MVTVHVAYVMADDNPLLPPFLRGTLKIPLNKGGRGVVFLTFLEYRLNCYKKCNKAIAV